MKRLYSAPCFGRCLVAASAVFGPLTAFADEKVYPATFCQAEERSDNNCLNYQRGGNVGNRCQRDVTVICPIIRDKAASNERFIQISVYYRSPGKDMACSLKSNALLWPNQELDECDFPLEKTAGDFVVYHRNTGQATQDCNTGNLPDSNPMGDDNRGNGYTLVCTIPARNGQTVSGLSYYFVNEPDN